MAAERPIVMASGATLVGLAIVGGTVLTVNLFALVTYHQRTELAALRALGLPMGARGDDRRAGSRSACWAASWDSLRRRRSSRAQPPLGVGRRLREPAAYAASSVRRRARPRDRALGTVVAVVTGWRAGRYTRIEHLDD